MFRNELADRYKRHPFHLWWSVYRFGKNHIREVIISGLFLYLILSYKLLVRNWRFQTETHVFIRRQDSSIGFGAPVRANMRSAKLTDSVVTSSLLESVSLNIIGICTLPFYNVSNSLIIWFVIVHFQVESSDLIAYGLIPEFIGRFPILLSLSALTEDQLCKVTSLSFSPLLSSLVSHGNVISNF